MVEMGGQKRRNDQADNLPSGMAGTTFPRTGSDQGVSFENLLGQGICEGWIDILQATILSHR